MSAGIIPVIGIKMATMLDRDEYIEQSYFFQTLGERMRNHIPIQETLASLREEGDELETRQAWLEELAEIALCPVCDGVLKVEMKGELARLECISEKRHLKWP